MTPRLLRDTEHLREVLGVPYSDEQLTAITADASRPGVIVAGAGSGKTEVMAARVVWLVGRGHVSPEAVLGLTFTKKAAGELAARIRRALELLAADARVADFLGQEGEPTVSTYHAYAGALIVEHGLRLGIEPDLQVISDASRFQRAARAVQTYPGELATSSTHLPTLVQDLVALDGKLSDHLVTPAALQAWDEELIGRLAHEKQVQGVKKAIEVARQRIELSRLVERYREAKADAGVMDFADQMAWGAQLAVGCPEVSAAERDRFAVVLLDEYQDTSVAQRNMLQGLYSGADVGHGRGHPVTAVGDLCQAIYGWRGASSDNLTGFLEHFPTADGDTGTALDLTVNRRCGTSILQLANDLAKPLYAGTGVARPLQPRLDAPTGEVRAACLPTVVEEIDWVADQVVELGHAAEPAAVFAWSDVAVLVREKSEIAALAAALRDRHVPVEVVGMSGLLQQPEVEDVVAMLEVVDSLTANAALLRLLTGPRWSIGARDLAILGTRARQLVSGDLGVASEDLADELVRAVSGIDPTEVLSLADALDDPGPLDYSDEARARFAELSELIGRLREHAADPLADLTRRVITALDLDVELAALPGASARQAQDNLALLLDTVADYGSGDAQPGLTGLLAYLHAEDDFNMGMDVAAPTDGDSVKLLTAHKSKGLEWAYVFVPFMSAGVFPSGKSRDRWITRARELPAELRGDAETQPEVEEWTPKGIEAYKATGKADALREELRLGYVAMTRARRLLVTSGHWWGRTQKNPRGPSDYLLLARDWLRQHGSDADVWAEDPIAVDAGASGTAVNPLLQMRASVAWPQPVSGDLIDRRRMVAADVRERIRGSAAGNQPAALDSLVADTDAEERDLERLRRLDADLDKLVAEARAAASGTVEVELPAALSATALGRLRDDPNAFARDLARPMPRRPSATARFGTRFHAWVETHLGQQPLLDESELPGRDDSDIDDSAELAELIERFGRGPYAERTPYAMEAPFELRLAGQQIRGRIDAVYAKPDGFEVVDWKTGRTADADPLQLAIYRLAWAEMHGIDPARVSAAFYYVRLDRVIRFDGGADAGRGGLPNRAALEQVVGTPAA